MPTPGHTESSVTVAASAAILKVAQPRILGIPESAESVIHHWDGAFAIPSVWFAGGVRDLSGPPEGTSRQHRDGGSRAFGVRPVFHAKRALEKGHGRSNCQSLFGIEKIPSDNYIRDMLDAADPALLQPCFERLEQLLAAPPLRAAFGRPCERT